MKQRQEKNRKVLIIDDDESILDAISLVLISEGYAVEITTKGTKISELIETFKPDVILLDVLMSGSDGREICKKIKQDPKSENTPVIMISAHPSASKSVFTFGADAFLTKPFETKDLLAIIKKYTENKKE